MITDKSKREDLVSDLIFGVFLYNTVKNKPGALVQKFIDRSEENARIMKTLTAEDFNHRVWQ